MDLDTNPIIRITSTNTILEGIFLIANITDSHSALSKVLSPGSAGILSPTLTSYG